MAFANLTVALLALLLTGHLDAAEKQLRNQLEQDLGRDLSGHKALIRAEVSNFVEFIPYSEVLSERHLPDSLADCIRSSSTLRISSNPRLQRSKQKMSRRPMNQKRRKKSLNPSKDPCYVCEL